MSKRLLLICLSFFLYSNIVIAENSKIVYVDVDRIINQSTAGINLLKQIKNINTKNASKFKKREQELIEIENKIIKKKMFYLKKILKNKQKH